MPRLASKKRKVFAKRSFHYSLPLVIGSFFILLLIIGFAACRFMYHTMYGGRFAHCGVLHQPKTVPPKFVVSAEDYMQYADFEYERGNCHDAIGYYSQAISLRLDFAEAYNNRGFAKMQMAQFDDARKDFNMALSYRPGYAFALLNRADSWIQSENSDWDKALADYDRVIALNDKGYHVVDVCGRRRIAKYHGWNPLMFVEILLKGKSASCR